LTWTLRESNRPYLIHSVGARANQFEVCVSRVEGSFFSNLLCVLRVGQSVSAADPHELFMLPASQIDSILIAMGTGIARRRGLVEHLFPGNHEDRARDQKI
jgi:ferredoxin-NADP reductase